MSSFFIDFVTYLSILIWLIVPFRQYKSYFFRYFVILALVDILTLVYFSLQIETRFDPYVPFTFLLLFAIFDNKTLKKYALIISSIFLIIIVFPTISQHHKQINYYLFFIIHLLIFIRFIYLFVVYQINFSAINWVRFLLVVYEVTILIKFSSILIPLMDAITYFYVTTLLEIILGLFFALFKEDNPKVIYKL